MSGPIVRTGTNASFGDNWDRIFGDQTTGPKKRSTAKTRTAKAAKVKTPAKPKASATKAAAKVEKAAGKATRKAASAAKSVAAKATGTKKAGKGKSRK